MQGKRKRLEGEIPREMGERPTSHKPSTKTPFLSPKNLPPNPRVRGLTYIEASKLSLGTLSHSRNIFLKKNIFGHV